MSLGFIDHTVDVFLAHAAVRLDRDLLLFARAEVLSGDMHDAVGINIEGNFDLRYSTRSWRDIRELEAAERLVAGSHLTLALQDVDIDGRLVIGSRREDLALVRRDRRIALDDLRADTAERLDTEGKRRDIEEQDVLDFTDEDTALDGSTDGYALIRVDALRRFFVQDIADGILDSRDTGRTADEDDLVDVVSREVCIGHGLARRAHRALDEVAREFIELCARQREVEVLRARGVRCDERQVDVRLRHARELDLGLLSSFLEALGSHLVLREVDAVLLLEFADHPVDDLLVEVIAAEVRIAVRRLDFERAFRELENRDIERAAAEVEDEDRLILVLVEAVGKCCCRRLVDDAQDIEACNLAGVLRRLALAVVEVSRNRDDSLRDRLTEVCFCIALELLQDHGRDFLRRVILAINRDLVVRVAHVALDGRDRAVRVRHSLALCQLADEALAILREADDRRRDAATFRVRDDGRFAAFHDGYDGVRRT